MFKLVLSSIRLSSIIEIPLLSLSLSITHSLHCRLQSANFYFDFAAINRQPLLRFAAVVRQAAISLVAITSQQALTLLCGKSLPLRFLHQPGNLYFAFATVVRQVATPPLPSGKPLNPLPSSAGKPSTLNHLPPISTLPPPTGLRLI